MVISLAGWLSIWPEEPLQHTRQLLSLQRLQDANKLRLAFFHELVRSGECAPPLGRQLYCIRAPILSTSNPPRKALRLQRINQRDHRRAIKSEGIGNRPLRRSSACRQHREYRVMACIQAQRRQVSVRHPAGRIRYAPKQIGDASFEHTG